jgi:class 3 adenylate cyclase
LIGRSTDCDVVLPSADVSRQHAKLEIEPNKFTITDLGSRNGVEVNGVRVHSGVKEAFSAGDHIYIADYILTIMECGIDEVTATKELAATPERRQALSRGVVEIAPPSARVRGTKQLDGERPTMDEAANSGASGSRRSSPPFDPHGATDPRVKLPRHDEVQSMVLLFLDIVDSTALTEQLGDEAFRRRSRKLDQRLRALVREQHGRPVEGKVLGDGILAIFMAAKHAIACALRCNTVAAAVDLQLHLGLHAGDVIQDGGNVYGGAVNIAARVAAASAPGEVLVSETVRTLSRTSTGVTFVDRGNHTLKGVAEPLRLYSVRERDQ